MDRRDFLRGLAAVPVVAIAAGSDPPSATRPAIVMPEAPADPRRRILYQSGTMTQADLNRLADGEDGAFVTVHVVDGAKVGDMVAILPDGTATAAKWPHADGVMYHPDGVAQVHGTWSGRYAT